MTCGLILIPTESELACVAEQLDSIRGSNWKIAMCGFGPIAAAARCGSLLASGNYDRVLLLGIAGSLDDRLQIGEAYSFCQVVCYGIGVGEGEQFMAAEWLGWNQWSNRATSKFESPTEELESEYAIGDRLDLLSLASNGLPPTSAHAAAPDSKVLLSACAASATPVEVERRIQRYPEAVAEDMEGFAVALACRMHDVPLTIVRGISNRAGQRDHRKWRIEAAMRSAVELTDQVLSDVD